MTDDATISLELSLDDVELVRTALHFLLSTLGRDEAEELGQVQALLGRPDAARAIE